MPVKKKSNMKKIKNETDLSKKLNKAEKDLEKLSKKVRRLEHTEQLFKQIGSITNKQFDLDSFLERIIERVQDATFAESAGLLILDESGDNLEFTIANGPGSNKLLGVSVSSAEGIAGWVIKNKKVYCSENVNNDPLWDPSVAKKIKYKTKNLIAAPLKSGGKVIGVIELLNKKGGDSFTKEDMDLLRILAAESSVAVENASNIIDSKRKAEQFLTLSRVSAILNSSLDPTEVRKRAMEAAVELLDCETGSLYLIDEEKNELYFEVALGEKGDAVKTIRLKMGEGVAGWVAQECKSDLVP